MNDLFIIILTSLKVSLAATLICSIFGIPAGYFIAVNRFRGKQTLITVLHTLLSVPTVVIGLFVYSLICNGSLLGNFRLIFSLAAIIMGQVILALPIMVVYAHTAITAVDRSARETALTLGASQLMVTRTVIREARFGLVAAFAATFGRLIGEVGISMMLGGNIYGYTRTMTTAIALETSKGEFALGLQLGVVLLVIALMVNLIFRHFKGKEES
jgi:tungstate transport system permease protein